MFGDGLMFMQWLYYDCPAESVYEQFLLCRRITGCVFSVLQGALVSACADDTLHLWNLRQRRPAILHSLKFNRERYAHTRT